MEHETSNDLKRAVAMIGIIVGVVFIAIYGLGSGNSSAATSNSLTGAVVASSSSSVGSAPSFILTIVGLLIFTISAVVLSRLNR